MTLKHVLLVDDEPDIRTIGEMSLAELGGFEVALADSGKAAIEAARRRRPDVVLLDVMMPEMDGPTTLEELRRHEDLKNVPIIFLTAKVQKEEIALYLGLGAAGVIKKPFDPLTLPEEVRRLVAEAE